MRAADAYAGHFEAQMRAARFRAGRNRGLRVLLWVFNRPEAIALAVVVAFCAFAGFAACVLAPVLFSGANGLAAVNTATGRLVSVTSLPGPLGAVLAADGSLWVADPGTGQVARVDPKTGAIAAQILVGGEPGIIADGGGAIWVTDIEGATVTRIDPATDSVTKTITLPWTYPGAMTVGAGGLWVADPAARQLAEIDLA
ncbi:MAG TPA: hypothetical protein VMG13_01340, partial [Trebonia sp.]|nr:hypothetical protein [Trebonia sp.]